MTPFHATNASTSTRVDQPSLVVVGTGIQWAAHTTLAAQSAIRQADCVLFAVADAWSARWVRELNPKAESLSYPRDGRSRASIYEGMVNRIVGELKRHAAVCAAFYGSPAVLARPAHEAVRRARAAGYAATMLPGVSSLDCLFADLGVDPGECGCQLFEAGDFVRRRLAPDPCTHLVLFQVAMTLNRGTYHGGAASIRDGLVALQERMAQTYPEDQALTLYEAASHPLVEPRRETVSLSQLHTAELTEITTLYVPPRATA